jgi:regulator of protease activity HflC (stomatin/prohibitin superfamily)
VEPGHHAVIFNIFTGTKPGIAREGWNLKLPFLERAFIFETRTRDRNFPTVTFNRDKQTVNITLRLLYKPRIEKLSYIFMTLGLDYDDRVLPCIVNEVLKTVIPQYDEVQLLTQREQVSSNIRRTLEQKASHYNIILDDVSITHLHISNEFEKAIEDKQVAQQEAEKAKNLVLKT